MKIFYVSFQTAFGQGLVARGKHWVLLSDNPEEANSWHRIKANEMFAEPIVVVKDGFLNTDEVETMMGLGLNLEQDLPENLNLLTLQSWFWDGSVSQTSKFYVTRIEHTFQTGEHTGIASI